jgi:hypothetical protein
MWTFISHNPMKTLTSILFVTVIALVLGATAGAAQKTTRIKVTALKKGKVQLTRGSAKSIIDLSKDISGCIQPYDRSNPKARPMDTTSFEKVDEASIGGKTYLLLTSEINSGCNVSGECGAATDLTIVWLALDSRLRVQKKKAVVVQSCFWGDINFVDEDQNLILKKGLLSVTIEENKYKQDLEYSVSTIKYDHARADEGLSVKTEKPARPK